MADSFTPGPWHAEDDTVWDTATPRAGAKDGVVVAECRPDLCGTPAEQREANARLIAAAPDLLACCRELLDLIDRDGMAPEIYRRAAESAIAKAVGRD